MKRPRLLLVQPSLSPPGGGNAVAVHAVQALREDFEITQLAWDPPDYAAINAYYGTTLRPADVTVRLVPRLPVRIRRWLGVRAALWQRYLMLRWARPLAGACDVVLSVNGEIDVGRRAVQYVHFPWGYWPRPDADLRWFHRAPGVLALYYRIGARLAPVAPERIAANLTLVNSDWTGARFRERYGGATITLHPPVAGAASPPPWCERTDTFAVVGLVSPGKRLERAVAIVDRVRTLGHDVGLRIIGSTRPGPYLRAIRRLAADRPWVTLHEDVSRRMLLGLISGCRYGLHAMPDEHFGIGVAEMAASGCVVFVPDGGGQREIVGGDERLVYRSTDDAARKIDRVLRGRESVAELLGALRERTAAMTPDRFGATLRALLAGSAVSAP